MDTHVPNPAKPISPFHLSQVTLGALELGELYIARSRLQNPRWRLHALLALTSSARSLDLSTWRMEPELRSCLDSLLARRNTSGLREIPSLVRELLPTWLGQTRGEVMQDLVSSLSESRHSAPFLCLRALLAAGQVESARSFAKSWGDPAVHHRLESLAASGLWGHGRDRRYVAPPFADDFPASLPRFIAMMGGSAMVDGTHQRGHLGQSQWTQADDLLSCLSESERQTALAHRAGALYRCGDFSLGAKAIRSIRYTNCRRLAWLCLLQESLKAGRLDDAWRALGQLASGAHHERGRLLLARELTRRGERRQALRLVAAPVMEPRQEERAILLCELRPWRLPQMRPPKRCSRPRKTEELRYFDGSIPSLEQRWTLLGLRIALERGVSADLKRTAFHDLGLWPNRLRRWAYDRVALRSWLRDLDARGHCLSSVLPILRRVTPDIVEPIWSEHLSLRAFSLSRQLGRRRVDQRLAEAFGQGLFATPAKEPKSSEAEHVLSTARAVQDEGVSWSEDAARRRRVILGAIKHCLKAWLWHGAETEKGALESRLRTLTHLGGILATELLVRSLEKARSPNRAYRLALVTLASLAPERAARLLFAGHQGFLLEADDSARSLLLVLENHGALEHGFSRQWCRFIGQVQENFGRRRGTIWLREWMWARPGTAHSPPSLAELECCFAEVQEEWPATGDEVISRVHRRLDALMRLPTAELTDTLWQDRMAIKRLLWLSPNRTTEGGRRLGVSSWKDNIFTLRTGLGQVAPKMVSSFAHRLTPGRARSLAQRLEAGAHPVADAPRIVDLPRKAKDRAPHRLRFLDKRRDFLTFLRLADCVPCCFNSASRDYRVFGLGYWVLALWKDPFSFAFHIEKKDVDLGWRPCGFVFGGFGLHDGESPVVLLNGIYLRRQESSLRAAVMGSLEESFCRPLGIHHIAIANRHGGRGELPKSYIQRTMRLSRLRALRESGPVSRIDDDISRDVNRPIYVDHLYWRDLGSPC